MVEPSNSLHQLNSEVLRDFAESSLFELKQKNTLVITPKEIQKQKDKQQAKNRSVLSEISLPEKSAQITSGTRSLNNSTLIPESVIQASKNIKSWQELTQEGLAPGFAQLARQIKGKAELARQKAEEERQNFLKQNLNTAQSGTDTQQVLEAFKEITPDNYKAGYLHADYSRLNNNSNLNYLLLREKDEGKLAYALRKFIFSDESKLDEKLGTLFDKLSYGGLSGDQAQKALVIKLITRDLENGIYAGIANKASGDKFSSESGDYLKTMKALGSLDILTERAEINNATQSEKESLKKLTEASATVLFNELKDKVTYLQLNDQVSSDQLKIARGLKMTGLNVPESTPMAVGNLINIVNKDAKNIRERASQAFSTSESLDKASHLVDLIQGVKADTRINQQSHVEPAKEALIKLVRSFAELSSRSAMGNLFKSEDVKDEANLLKVFQFIYDNDKYPSGEEILNTKQAFIRDINCIVDSRTVDSLLSAEMDQRLKEFQQRMSLSAGVSPKNLLERNQDKLARLGEIVDGLTANSGNKRGLFSELQTTLIQSQAMLETSLEKNSETELAPVKRNSTIEEKINNSTKNAGAHLFPLSDSKESWKMLLNLQKAVKYLNTEEGEAQIRANFAPNNELKNSANQHLQNMIQELMRINENTVSNLVADDTLLNPFGKKFKAEDVELISQIYPNLEKSAKLALFTKDEPSLVLKKLNEKFCQALDDREVDNDEKKSLIRAYAEFFQKHICESTTNDAGQEIYSLKNTSPVFLISQSVEKDWAQMKTFQRLSNYFGASDPMKLMSQKILSMMSLVVLGMPGFTENLINTGSIWSKKEDGQDKLNLKAEDLRLLARLYAVRTEGFKPSGTETERTQYINTRDQSLTRLKDKIVTTLGKDPKGLMNVQTGFEKVLKDCFIKQDGSLEDFNGYTQQFIELIGNAFDPHDRNIQAIY
jgi:hypothetical protein